MSNLKIFRFGLIGIAAAVGIAYFWPRIRGGMSKDVSAKTPLLPKEATTNSQPVTKYIPTTGITSKDSSQPLGTLLESDLIALSLVGGQDGIYAELAKRDPKNKKIILTLLLTAPDSRQKYQWAKLLCEVEPKNGMNWLFLAAAASEVNDREQALTSLSRVALAPSFYSDKETLEMELKAYAAKSGFGTREATEEFAAKAEVDIKILRQIGMMAKSVKNIIPDNFEVADEQTRKSVTDTLGAVRRLDQMQGSSLPTQLTAWSVEKALLSSIPGDFEYGDTGISVGQRLAWLTDQQKQVKPISDEINSILSTADQATTTSYLEREKIEGRILALEWLRTLKKQ